MARWYKKNYYTLECNDFVFEYETAYELGVMVRESGCKMPNPYEPDNTDYDDFINGWYSA